MALRCGPRTGEVSRGVVCRVKTQDEVQVARRIEVLAEGAAERIGLLRKLFVGFSSQPEVLDVARRSNYVVEVRSLDWNQKHIAEQYKQDVVVLKRAIDQFGHLRAREGVWVPSIWMEKVGLSTGDRVIVSNPLRNYLLPSPSGVS